MKQCFPDSRPESWRKEHPNMTELSRDVAGDLVASWEPWLAEHGDRIAALRDASLVPQPAAEYLAAQRDYHQALYDTGWLSQGWPTEFGGAGGDAIVRAAVYDFLGQRGFPVPTTVNVLEVL